MVTQEDLKKVFLKVSLSRDFTAYLLWAFEMMEGRAWDVATVDTRLQDAPSAKLAWMRTLMTQIEDFAGDPSNVGFVPVRLRSNTWSWLWIPTGRLAITIDFWNCLSTSIVVEDVEAQDDPLRVSVFEAAYILGLPDFHPTVAGRYCLELEGNIPIDHQIRCIETLRGKWHDAVFHVLSDVASSAGMYPKLFYTPESSEEPYFLLNPEESWARVARILAREQAQDTLLNELRATNRYPGGVGSAGLTPRRYVSRLPLDTVLTRYQSPAARLKLYNSYLAWNLGIDPTKLTEQPTPGDPSMRSRRW